MSNANINFTQQNQRHIDKLVSEGKTVITAVQNVHGTAYQKTSHRILQEVANGNRDIVVLTNSNNPMLPKLQEIVRQANLTLSAATVTLKQAD